VAAAWVVLLRMDLCVLSSLLSFSRSVTQCF